MKYPMPTIHLLTGLPGSGKTTHAWRLVDASERLMVRTSLDDIRDMLGFTPGRSTASKEKLAKLVEDSIIRTAVLDGRDVVIDNCNLNPAGPLRIKQAVGGIEGVAFVVHDFTHVHFRTCVARDAQRDDYDPVGGEVIRRLFGQLDRARRQGWRLTSAWMNDSAALVPGREGS